MSTASAYICAYDFRRSAAMKYLALIPLLLTQPAFAQGTVSYDDINITPQGLTTDHIVVRGVYDTDKFVDDIPASIDLSLIHI